MKKAPDINKKCMEYNKEGTEYNGYTSRKKAPKRMEYVS